MTTIKFRNRTFDRIIEQRQIMRACEHAASIVARFCPAADVEAYVQTCERAERTERLHDAVIDVINAFVAPLLGVSIGGGPGLLAAMLFIVLWLVFGLGQLMTYKIERRTEAVARAASKLCDRVAWSDDELEARGITLRMSRGK